MNTHSPDFLDGERASLMRLRDELVDACRRAQARQDSGLADYRVAGGVVVGLEHAIARLNLELARVEEKQHRARLGL